MWQPLRRPASGKFNFRDAARKLASIRISIDPICSLYLQVFKLRLLKRPRDGSVNFHRECFNYRDNWLDDVHDTMHNNFLIEMQYGRDLSICAFVVVLFLNGCRRDCGLTINSMNLESD